MSDFEGTRLALNRASQRSRGPAGGDPSDAAGRGAPRSAAGASAEGTATPFRRGAAPERRARAGTSRGGATARASARAREQRRGARRSLCEPREPASTHSPRGAPKRRSSCCPCVSKRGSARSKAPKAGPVTSCGCGSSPTIARSTPSKRRCRKTKSRAAPASGSPPGRLAASRASGAPPGATSSPLTARGARPGSSSSTRRKAPSRSRPASRMSCS